MKRGTEGKRGWLAVVTNGNIGV